MNEFPPSRVLMLEQLESRCLLTGGLFSHALTLGDELSGRRDNMTLDHQRGAPIRGFGSRTVVDFDHLRLSEYRHLPRDSDRMPSESLTHVIDLRVIQPILVVIRFEKHQTSESQTAERLVAVTHDHNQSMTSKPNPSLASKPPVSTPVVVREMSSATSRGPASDFLTTAKIDSLMTDTTEPRRNSPLQPKPIVSLSANDATTNSSSGSAWIDLPSTLRHDPTGFAEDLTVPWKLDSGLLHQLRGLNESNVEDSKTLREDQVDAAISSWFGGTTGLLELRGNGALPITETMANSPLTIALDATIGQYRDLGVLTSDASPNIPKDLTATILAAIASEEIQFAQAIESSTPNPTGSASLSASNAAILATSLIGSGIAMTGRRRRSARLEFTNSTDE